MDSLKPSEVSDILLGQLRDMKTDLQFEEIGKALQVSDGVVRIYGLDHAEAGELLDCGNGVMAVVMNLETDKYENDRTKFNAAYDMFHDFWRRNHMPLTNVRELRI